MMNDLAEPPADDATEYRWMVPTEPAFDYVAGVPHEFDLPPGEPVGYFAATCGGQFTLNELSRAETEGDEPNRCRRCVLNRRRPA